MAFLEFANNMNLGKRKYFSDTCTIGRDPSCDIYIKDNSVSRRHAAIRFTGDFYVIQDLGSKNGVLVNDKTLAGYVSRPLYDKDRITVSTAVMIFYSEGKMPPSGKTVLAKERKPVTCARSSTDVMGGMSIVLNREEAGVSPRHAEIDASLIMADIDREAEEQNIRAAVKRFQAMVKVSSELGSEVKLEVLLNKIMDRIFDIFPQADRSFIMLPRTRGGEMKPVAGRRRFGKGNQEEAFEVSQTIINSVIQKKQSVLSSNALSDNRFAGGQSIADFSIRSLMYVPFIHKAEILGIITLDTTSSERAFNKDDLAMLTGIAAQAAIAIKNVQLYKEIERESQVRTQLSRYLSPDIVEGIIEGTIPLRLGGEEKYGTVLFSDIVGFTSMAENMSALEVVERLNRYFLLVTGIVTRNRGTLHKFEGDMVMAFWNVMFEDKDGEMNAVRTALEMQIAVWLMDLELAAEGQVPVYIGIGCNTGAFAGGNIGGTDKMEYTVIGDNINAGKRIESLSSRGQVFIAESTYTAIKEKCCAIGLPPTNVKGKTLPVKAFSIRGILSSTGEMLLNIPVLIKDRTGEYTGRGMLYGSYIKNGGLHAQLYTTSLAFPGVEMTMKIDAAETGQLFELTGKVVSALDRKQGAKSICSDIVIADIKTDDMTAGFFRSGFFIETSKKWEDMKRH